MVLDANIKVMTSLRDFYRKLSNNEDFDLKDLCAGDVLAFVQQTTDMIHTFSGYERRIKLLIDMTENRKNLVGFMSDPCGLLSAHQRKLLQKLQSRATKKMEDLTTMSYRETIVMKVITAGTFVFLPATFVSVSYTEYLRGHC